jgi:penicillin-binding protein 1C
LKRYFKGILILILTGAALKLLPVFSSPLLEGTSFSKVIYDRHGKLLRLTTSGDEKYRIYTKVEDVNPDFIEALLLLEDQHFYYHPGVNPVSLAKATISTFIQKNKMGASTLTMQVARLKYGIYSRSIAGKFHQIAASTGMELFHRKKEILETYLNLAPYGANIEGLGAASLIYFGKKPKDLTLAEILSLVVIPQSPQERSLGSVSVVSEDLLAARQRLFEKWIDKHPQDADKNIDLRLPIQIQKLSRLPFEAPHFVNYVIQKKPDEKNFKTTLDLNIQKSVEQRVKSYLQAQLRFGIQNASALVINYETMETLAWVGSADFFNDEIEGQVNGVVARRSPGSAIKPFVYALALDQSLIHPLTMLKDAPSSFGSFDPENFDQQFVGPISATEALIQSRNIPAVYLASRLKNPSVFEFLKTQGLDFTFAEKYYGLAIALGGAEVTMLDMAKLYASLARLGQGAQVKFIQNTKDEYLPQMISKEAAFVTLDMLTQNPRPHQTYNAKWLKSNDPIAWKTGTSHGFRDAWTVGIAGPYVIAVWLGNFNGDGNPSLIGRDMAAPLFFDIVSSLRNNEFVWPSWKQMAGLNLKKVKVCSVSGHLPGHHCHGLTDTYFIPGKSPITTCDVHREVLVSKLTGERLCDPMSPNAKAQVFEFWPSDLLILFKQAGISRRGPPPYQKSCALTDRESNGSPPMIVSPKLDVAYNVRVESEEKSLPLKAVADGDVKKLYWFIGSQFIGSTEPEKTLFWPAEPGRHTVRVVDSSGRSDSRELKVEVVK